MLRKLLTVTLLALAALGTGAPHAGAATVTVDMFDNNTFVPPDISVNAGDTIVFRNAGAAPHTATVKGLFDSGNVMSGQTYEVVTDATFPSQPFEYVCTLHVALGMKGMMTVAGATGEMPATEAPAEPQISPRPEAPDGLLAGAWQRTENLPIGLRVFAPLALLLFLALCGLAALGYMRALKKAKQA